MKAARSETSELVSVADLLPREIVRIIETKLGIVDPSADPSELGIVIAKYGLPEDRARLIVLNRSLDKGHRAAVDEYLIRSLRQVAACFAEMHPKFTWDHAFAAGSHPRIGLPAVRAQLARICALSERLFGDPDAFAMSWWLRYLTNDVQGESYTFREFDGGDDGEDGDGTEPRSLEIPYPHMMHDLFSQLHMRKQQLFVAATAMSNRCHCCAAPAATRLPRDLDTLGRDVGWTRCSQHSPRLLCFSCAICQAVQDDDDMFQCSFSATNINMKCALMMADMAATNIADEVGDTKTAFTLLFRHPVLEGSFQEYLGLSDAQARECKVLMLERFAEDTYTPELRRERLADRRREEEQALREAQASA